MHTLVDDRLIGSHGEKGGLHMGLGDKISNQAEEAKGKLKEGAGEVTGDEQLEAEGKLEQGKAKFKQGVEDLKDTVAEKFNDATDDKS